MSVRINTNTDALAAMRNLGTTAARLTQATERLSSGLRINHAADDAAGLSISQKLEAQVRGTAAAQRNAQDAVSLLQTADGALDEVHTILQRMRELAVQGGSDTLTSNDRNAISVELTQLSTELNSIGSNVTFNAQVLLSGTYNATFQVGPDSGMLLNVNFSTVISSTLGTGSVSTGLASIPTQNSVASCWSNYIGSVDSAITSVSTQRATIGASQNRLSSIVRRLGVANENMASAESRIRDADMAAESVNFNKNNILSQAGIAVLAQANMGPNQLLTLLR